MNKSAASDKIFQNYSSALKILQENLSILEQNPEKSYIDGSYASVYSGLLEHHEASTSLANREIKKGINFLEERIEFFGKLRRSRLRTFFMPSGSLGYWAYGIAMDMLGLFPSHVSSFTLRDELKYSGIFLEQTSKENAKYKVLTPPQITIKLSR